MSTSIETLIRPATAEDLEKILEIWIEFMDYLDHINPNYWKPQTSSPAFRKHLEKCLDQKKKLVVVAEEGKKIAGFSLAYIENLPEWFGAEEIGLIRYLAISKDYHEKGIGQKVTNYLISWFRSKNIKRVELYVLNGLPASEFWKKQGFQEFMDRRFLNI